MTSSGESSAVDFAAIEKSLSDLWRGAEQKGERAVTKAALWNVIAHTANPAEQARAGEVLSRVSEVVPQRALVVRADFEAADDLATWVSANCHLVGGGSQVCSEEVTIVAGGTRVSHVPPLVQALLLPDMPVAVWWLGDIPASHERYVLEFLAPASRLIVDSSRFDRPSDLDLVSDIAGRSITAAADLNWVRMEEWRIATASLFDPEASRPLLGQLQSIAVTYAGSGEPFFGDAAESLLVISWFLGRLGLAIDEGGNVAEIDVGWHQKNGTNAEAGTIVSIEFSFRRGERAAVEKQGEGNVLIASLEALGIEVVTRARERTETELIARLLKRPEADLMYVGAMPGAVRLSQRTSWIYVPVRA